MRFSEHFGLGGNQQYYDFVDVPVDTDIKVFIDPYALATTRTEWAEKCHETARDFFQAVLNRLQANDRPGAEKLLRGLPEDNRTRLGYSSGKPKGTGFGGDKVGPFLDALEQSEAFKTGKIEDIEDAALFVEGVGFDIVSDMVTNILRLPLAEYTRWQCELHGVAMDAEEQVTTWAPGEGWVKVKVKLPTDGTWPIILVPKAVVRMDLSLDAEDYFNDFMDEYCDNGAPGAIESLEKMIQIIPQKPNGKAHRKDLKDKLKDHGSFKRIMSQLSNSVPDAYKGYKTRARERRPVLRAVQIEELHRDPRPVDLRPLIVEMFNAAKNFDDVAGSVKSVSHALTAAFFPLLQYPRPLSTPLNGFEGVVFSNASEAGFLWGCRLRFGRPYARNVVVLTSNQMVASSTLAHFNSTDLMRNTESGLVIVVAPAIDPGLGEARRKSLSEGVLLTTYADIAAVLNENPEPESAFERLIKSAQS